MKIKEIQYHEVKWQNLATIIYDDWSLTTIPEEDMYNFDWVRAFLNKQNSGQVQLVLPSQDEELKKDGLKHTLDSYYPAWKKESDNKLSYELDRYFIEAMAKRMDQHKGKYPPYNRQKPMDVQKLKEALNRHNVEIQKGNYDDEDKYDHLSAIACNAMFIYYQLKNHD